MLNLATSSRAEINRTIGKKVADTRAKRGMTQGKLGLLIGVHPQTMLSYEKGHHAIPADKLMLIAHYLRVSVSEFAPPEVR